MPYSESWQSERTMDGHPKLSSTSSAAIRSYRDGEQRQWITKIQSCPLARGSTLLSGCTFLSIPLLCAEREGLVSTKVTESRLPQVNVVIRFKANSEATSHEQCVPDNLQCGWADPPHEWNADVSWNREHEVYCQIPYKATTGNLVFIYRCKDY